MHNIILFCRALRALGMDVTPTHVIDLVEALEHIEVGSRRDFKATARTILLSRHEHLELFDWAFDQFWQSRKRGDERLDLGMLLQKAAQPQEQSVVDAPRSQPPAQDKPRDEPYRENPVLTYSAQEVLRQKDFAELTPEEREQIRRLMQSMKWDLEQRTTRRKRASSRGNHPDMRRTLRHNLRHGGEPLLLRWRSPKKRRRPLVVICDISGSMEAYSRLLLQFVYAMSNGLRHTEAFVFGTRLTRISHHLREQEVDGALRQVAGTIHDWAGGTRIGKALRSFNYEWARRVLAQGAIVMIISDGWDRGDIFLLEREMARLQRSCHRLIWLNPLLGSPRYEPITRGMQTALPYVDDFLPVHNLMSLEQLANLLVRLSEHRPRRRQMLSGPSSTLRVPEMRTQAVIENDA